jgi:tetratricopeptide (TPR) repeat protein
LLFGQNTFQATVTVCVTLVAVFIITGFASTAYHRKRDALATVHYNRGSALENHGQLQPALEEYRKALLFSPDNTQYRLSLATALLESNHLDEAQSHLEQLLQENPTSGPINLLLGRLAVQQHRLKEAIEYYQRGVYEYWPESQVQQRRQARWELANLLNKTGDRNGFIGELMQLYTNLPTSGAAQKVRIGFLLLSNGATSEASRVFQDLSKQWPRDAEVQRGLGETYFGSGEYVAARHAFERALRLRPNDEASVQGLALTNAVIDMDAALPYITSVEQMRRNKNLLSRVIKDLQQCGTTSDALKQQLEDASKLLVEVPSTEDPAFTRQTTAAKLWSERASFCGAAVPQDRALDTVLTRIGRE